MTKFKARGQITVTDLSDARTIQMFLKVNHYDSQIFSQDGQLYTPDYTAEPLLITPEMFISGENGDQITKVKSSPTWTINGLTPKEFGATISDTAPWTLSINKNMVDDVLWKIDCEINWEDDMTGLTVPVKSSCTIRKVTNAGQLAAAEISANSLVFYNNYQGVEPKEIILEATLRRGGTLDTTDTDNTPYICRWYEAGKPEVLAEGNNRTFKITPDMVDNIKTFRVVITDQNEKSSTYQKQFSKDITITDMSDPYSIDIVSSNGEIFKNGQGGSTLTAILKCGGIEVVDHSKETYTWIKKDKDGNIDSTFTASTQSIKISASDIVGKAIYECEIDFEK